MTQGQEIVLFPRVIVQVEELLKGTVAPDQLVRFIPHGFFMRRVGTEAIRRKFFGIHKRSRGLGRKARVGQVREQAQ